MRETEILSSNKFTVIVTYHWATLEFSACFHVFIRSVSTPVTLASHSYERRSGSALRGKISTFFTIGLELNESSQTNCDSERIAIVSRAVKAYADFYEPGRIRFPTGNSNPFLEFRLNARFVLCGYYDFDRRSSEYLVSTNLVS